MWIYKSKLSCAEFLKNGGKFARRYIDELNCEYERLKDSPMPELSYDAFNEFFINGNRTRYEKLYFLRRIMLRDFALKAWLGDNGAIARLEKILKAVCAERTWALPAHTDGKNMDVIDLFAAETAQSVTEIVSLLYDRLNKETVIMCIDAVKSRVLTPFVNRREKYNWESMENNWCAVCGGCVGMTAIYLIEKDSELRAVTDSLEGVLESYMKSFSADGACLEGLYYWNYGMVYLISFLQLYMERTGKDFPVRADKLALMAAYAQKCRMTDGFTVSFSDGGERDRIYSGLSAYLSDNYGTDSADGEYILSLYGDDCGRWCRAARDIAWTKSHTAGDASGISVFDKAQIAVVRGENISFSFKGGTNGEPHNHNDIGSFSVIKNGAAILCDLGAGEYTRDYFSEKRYETFCAGSFGHSVPIFDGGGQSAGEHYRACKFGINGNMVYADISGAYETARLIECVRCISLENGKVTLTDKYKAKNKMRITERFITRLDAAETAEGVDIIIGKKTAASLVTNCSHKTEIKKHAHYEHDGTQTQVTVIDFIFDIESNFEFRLEIK